MAAKTCCRRRRFSEAMFGENFSATNAEYPECRPKVLEFSTESHVVRSFVLDSSNVSRATKQMHQFLSPGSTSGNAKDATRLLITSREAATFLSISERTLWTLTNKGDLPRVPIGRSVRYDPLDLVAWIERQKTAGRAAAHNTSSTGNLPSKKEHESQKDEESNGKYIQ